MSTRPPLSHAFHRLYSKRGDNDCAIAAMAIIFRRDPERVLLAAGRVSKTVWDAGLAATEMVRVARRLRVTVRWLTRGQFDPDEDTGVLWVGYHDKTVDHCVALIDGRVIDPEYTPAIYAPWDEYSRAMNCYANSLLVVKE